MLIDLQLHSTYSDGYLTPTELVKFIARQGIRAVALTDHNTVSGLYEFRRACRSQNIKPITGLELYVKLHRWHFNVLWYNFDDADPVLHNLLRDSQRRRRRNARIILERLVKRGFRIRIDSVLDKYNHYVPINHLVDDILEIPANLAKVKREQNLTEPEEGDFIGEYLRNKSIGVFHESYIDLERVVALKKRLGGQLILCHPAKQLSLSLELFTDLKNAGLDGVEKMTPHHSYGAIMYIQRLSRMLDWTETGGSDFHRFEGRHQPVQHAWEYFSIDSRWLRGVNRIIGKI